MSKHRMKSVFENNPCGKMHLVDGRGVEGMQTSVRRYDGQRSEIKKFIGGEKKNI